MMPFWLTNMGASFLVECYLTLLMLLAYYRFCVLVSCCAPVGPSCGQYTAVLQILPIPSRQLRLKDIVDDVDDAVGALDVGGDELAVVDNRFPFIQFYGK